MPEGPEVTIVKYFIKGLIEGHKLISIYTENRKKYNLDILRSNMTIENIFNKGKCIFIKLTDQYGSLYIYNHLNMTGKWITDTNSNHIKLSITTDKTTIYFDDVRSFGKFEVMSEQNYINKINQIGPDLLNEIVSWEQYYAIYKQATTRSNMDVAKFLLEQKYLSGIGNYLKSEILYNSRINPSLGIKELNDTQIYTLYYISIYMIRYAYQCGGMTIQDFVNPFSNGNGGFKPYVYNQPYDPCGNKVVKITQSTRTTHWVPVIQH